MPARLRLPALALAISASACSGVVSQGAVSNAVQYNFEHRYAETVTVADYVGSDGGYPAVVVEELTLLKAEAFEAMGRKGEAIALYRFVVQKYRESGAAWQARGRLDALGVSCDR